jgi:quinol-cytochrome oxidoreductase complex cytochrome b subunit
MDDAEPEAEPEAEEADEEAEQAEETALPPRLPLEQRAATMLAVLGGVGLAGAVVTGIPLLWTYRPTGTGGVRALHALSSSLFLGATAGLVLVMIVATVRRRPVWTGWAPPLVGFGAAAAAAFTGSLIAWDMLVLRAVTVGRDLRGAFAPLDGDVRAVFVGGKELSPGTYLAWLVVHVVVVTAVAGLAAWMLRRRSASRPLP